MNKEEFKNIYDNYFDAIRNYIFYKSGNTDIATDITQEAFIKIWEKQVVFNPQKNKSLLYKIAGDLFINYIRHKKVETNYLSGIKFSFVNDSLNNNIEYKELKKNYEVILLRLSEKQRIVFLMSRNEELSYKEIADRLNISVKAVEKRMSKALVELRTVLK